jgi:glutamate formiminotransferase/formiminotetrahydrofolate cyclodeaminase
MLKEEKCAQVSCNMTHYIKTPLHRVFETVKREAARHGVGIKESEIVGLVPEKALIDAAIYYMQLDRFGEDQILEYKLHGKGTKQSIMDFLHTLALATPTPGGGSVAALQAALGAALLSMVTGITVKKTKDKELLDFHGFLKLETHSFYTYIDKDKDAFDQVLRAFKIQADTDQEKEAQARSIQDAYKYAAQIPFEVCKKILHILPYAKILAEKGLKNAISDVGVALYSLHSAFHAARVNILINLSSITDKEFNESIKTQVNSLQKQEEKLYAEIDKIFLTKL